MITFVFGLLKALTFCCIIKFSSWSYMGLCPDYLKMLTRLFLFYIDSEGGAGGSEACLIARLVCYSVALQTPKCACCPCLLYPLCMPCSCKNANKACLVIFNSYFLIFISAFSSMCSNNHLLWVGLCDILVEGQISLLPQLSSYCLVSINSPALALAIQNIYRILVNTSTSQPIIIV